MTRSNETSDYESKLQDSKTETSDATVEFSSLCHYVKVLPTPEIPKHFPFSHSSTRWLLSNIVSENGIRRIVLKHRQQQFLLSHFFEIPDKPNLLIKTSYGKSAFSVRTIMYLTPVALTVYLRQNDALETILRHLPPDQIDLLRDRIHQPEFTMVDNQSSPEGDICCFNIGVIAILRMNVTALILLMKYNIFDPHAEFVCVKKQHSDETIFYYRDILDYLVYQLRKQPCMPVGTMTQQLLQNSCQMLTVSEGESRILSGVHLNMFERPLNCSKLPTEEKYVSLLQRLLLLILDQTYFAYEVGTPMLSVLEVIVKTNYLALMANKTNSDFVPRYLKSLSLMMEKTSLFSEMSFEKSKGLFEKDVITCVGLLIRWYENCVEDLREVHCHRIVNLITKILLDSRLMPIIFEESESALINKFSILASNNSSQKIKPSETTIRELKISVFDLICDNSSSKKKFLKMIKSKQEVPLPSRQSSQQSKYKYTNSNRPSSVSRASSSVSRPSSVCCDTRGDIRDMLQTASSIKQGSKVGVRKNVRAASPATGTVILADRSISQNSSRRNGQFACITVLRHGYGSKLDNGLNNNNDLSFASRCLLTSCNYSKRNNSASKGQEIKFENKETNMLKDKRLSTRHSRHRSCENARIVKKRSNSKCSDNDEELQRPLSRQRSSSKHTRNRTFTTTDADEAIEIPRLIGRIIGIKKGDGKELNDSSGEESFATKLLLGDKHPNCSTDVSVPRLDLPVSSDDEIRELPYPEVELSSRSVSE